MFKRIKQALEWIGHIQTIQAIIYTEFFRTLFLPTVWTVLTAAGGYAQHLPVMWIMMASAVSFMAVTIAIFAGSLLIKRKNPLNKLSYQVIFQCDLNAAEMPQIGNRQQRRAAQAQHPRPQILSPTQISNQVAREIEKGQLGIELTNNSTFPISCLLQSAETEIEGEPPPRSAFPKQPALIQPGGKLRLLDDPIQLDHMPCQRLAGKMDHVIKYGLPGKEHCELRVRGKVDIVMEYFGFVSAIIFSYA